MKFAIVYNQYASSGSETTLLVRKIEYFIINHGHEVICFEGSDISIEAINKVDYIICVGGDGTLLKAAHYANDIPVLGINMGRKGFLAEVEKINIEETLMKVLNREYKIKTYPFVEALCNKYSYKDYAMNDVTIYRSNVGKTLSLSIYVDEKFVYNFMGDGIIISTAAGSTAYNLSVGGPICLHECGSLLITPISAHSLTVKTVVISDKSKIDIKVNPDVEYPCGEIITCDGVEGNLTLAANDVVTIKKSEKHTKFIYFEDNNIFDVMKRKLL